jgi:fructuronate reductase
VIDPLSQSLLATLAPQVQRPRYDRRALATGIVHFGPGAFHRAHQAWFVENLLPHDLRWGISAVSLRSTAVRDALAPQDGLYTLVTLDAEVSYQVIGALREILVAPEDSQQVLQRLSAPATRVVTITVTEKGYCLTPDGGLDVANPDILRDLRDPRTPVSLIGYLVEALDRRRRAGSATPTIISCDNLIDNGTRLGRAVAQLARMRDASLASWIEDHAQFPRTMVDSITPATTDALRERVASTVGFTDRWPVQRERFVQWVMEDRLNGDGPDWQAAGVTVTNDVSAYERAKLRLLNGAHSTLAYVGLLAGCETVAEAMKDADLARFVASLMRDDIRPSLVAPRGLDLERYILAVLERFCNPALRHALAQIAWDGSQKLPFRLFPTIVAALAASRSIGRLCVPVAAWMQFIRRKALAREPVTDPLAVPLAEIGRACENRAVTDVTAFLRLDSVFPPALAADTRFVSAVSRAYDDLAGDPPEWNRILR